MRRITPAQALALHGEAYYRVEMKRAAERRMAVHDSLPAEWRSLVHDYGLLKVLKLYHQRLPAWKARAILNPITLDLDF